MMSVHSCTVTEINGYCYLCFPQRLTTVTAFFFAFTQLTVTICKTQYISGKFIMTGQMVIGKGQGGGEQETGLLNTQIQRPGDLASGQHEIHVFLSFSAWHRSISQGDTLLLRTQSFIWTLLTNRPVVLYAKYSYNHWPCPLYMSCKYHFNMAQLLQPTFLSIPGCVCESCLFLPHKHLFFCNNTPVRVCLLVSPWAMSQPVAFTNTASTQPHKGPAALLALYHYMQDVQLHFDKKIQMGWNEQVREMQWTR